MKPTKITQTMKATATSEYEVKVLKPGYATWVGPTQQRAGGTITLIKGPKSIIVDTGGPWNKQSILAALKKHQVRPEDVDFVVCTHGHSDHTGNNNLFPNSTFIVSYDVCKGDLYTFHDFAHGQPYKIDDNVEIISTPGHSTQDISVIVRTAQGVVAVVGDLFENKDDLEHEDLWRSFSELPEEQEKNRKRVLEFADFIVPGHGDMFAVNRGKVVDRAFVGDTQRPGSGESGFSRLVWYILVPLVITLLGGIIIWWLTNH